MSSTEQIRIGVFGTGRIAQALGRLLSDSGETVVAVAGWNSSRAHAAAAFIAHDVAAVSPDTLSQYADHILIAVPDRAVCGAALTLANSGMHSGVALHTAGSLGPEALQPLIEAGVSCGVFHPLQTVPSKEAGVQSLPGSTYGITGMHAARVWAEYLATQLAGHVLVIPAEKIRLYHMAAVMASNAIIGIIDAASGLMEAAGIERDRALSALQPLAEASIQNVASLGPEDALTGPIERGDVDTIREHLNTLGASSPNKSADNTMKLYLAVSFQLLDIARRRGLTSTKAVELERILSCGGTDAET